MKKKLIYIAIFVILVCCVYADELSEAEAQSEAKLTNFSELGVNEYKLEGFDFERYKLDNTNCKLRGLEKIITAEHIILQKANTLSGGMDVYKYQNKYGRSFEVNKPTAPFALIGHSQGGLRSLALAKHIKESDAELYKNLKAVITVSGIDRGLKALEGGLGVLTSKLKCAVRTMADGFTGCVVGMPVTTTGVIAYAMHKGNLETEINRILKENPAIIHYVLPILSLEYLKNNKVNIANTRYDGLEESAQEIYDMVPQSNFIKKNVIEAVPYQYRVQTGTARSLELIERRNRWGWKYWVLEYRYTPVYSYYTGYRHISKIDPKLPVGYIVGKLQNSFELVETKFSSINKTMDNLKIYFRVAAGVNFAKYILTLGIGVHFVYFGNCCIEAADLCKNYKGYLTGFIGSIDNDGLVATESQYIPQKDIDAATGLVYDVHTNVLRGGSNGYEVFNCNHMEIISNDKVKLEIKTMLEDAKPKD